MAKKKNETTVPAKAQKKTSEKPKKNNKKEVAKLEKTYESITGKKPKE